MVVPVVEQRYCPACNTKVGLNVDFVSRKVLSSCPVCGWMIGRDEKRFTRSEVWQQPRELTMATETHKRRRREISKSPFKYMREQKYPLHDEHEEGELLYNPDETGEKYNFTVIKRKRVIVRKNGTRSSKRSLFD